MIAIRTNDISDDFVSSNIIEYTVKTLNSISLKFELSRLKSKVNEDFFLILDNAHKINAKIESIRDYIECYHINDILQDEDILQDISDMLSERKDEIEMSLDVLEAMPKMPNNANEVLYNAIDEVYSNIINAEFAISQKIAKAYLDTQSYKELLQEA